MRLRAFNEGGDGSRVIARTLVESFMDIWRVSGVEGCLFISEEAGLGYGNKTVVEEWDRRKSWQRVRFTCWMF